MATNGQTPASWRDKQGRIWSTAVTIGTIKRVKDLIGENLIDVFDGGLLGRMADDPILLVNTLYAVCKPQADERGITDEQFGELLAGDTIEVAADALVGGIIGFFPSGRREILSRLWTATTQTRAQAAAIAVEKLDSPQMAAALAKALEAAGAEVDRRLRTLGDSAGNWQESSGLTPVP